MCHLYEKFILDFSPRSFLHFSFAINNGKQKLHKSEQYITDSADEMINIPR